MLLSFLNDFGRALTEPGQPDSGESGHNKNLIPCLAEA